MAHYGSNMGGNIGASGGATSSDMDRYLEPGDCDTCGKTIERNVLPFVTFLCHIHCVCLTCFHKRWEDNIYQGCPYCRSTKAKVQARNHQVSSYLQQQNMNKPDYVSKPHGYQNQPPDNIQTPDMRRQLPDAQENPQYQQQQQIHQPNQQQQQFQQQPHGYPKQPPDNIQAPEMRRQMPDPQENPQYQQQRQLYEPNQFQQPNQQQQQQYQQPNQQQQNQQPNQQQQNQQPNQHQPNQQPNQQQQYQQPNQQQQNQQPNQQQQYQQPNQQQQQYQQQNQPNQQYQQQNQPNQQYQQPNQPNQQYQQPNSKQQHQMHQPPAKRKPSNKRHSLNTHVQISEAAFVPPENVQNKRPEDIPQNVGPNDNGRPNIPQDNKQSNEYPQQPQHQQIQHQQPQRQHVPLPIYVARTPRQANMLKTVNVNDGWTCWNTTTNDVIAVGGEYTATITMVGLEGVLCTHKVAHGGKIRRGICLDKDTALLFVNDPDLVFTVELHTDMKKPSTLVPKKFVGCDNPVSLVNVGPDKFAIICDKPMRALLYSASQMKFLGSVKLDYPKPDTWDTFGVSSNSHVFVASHKGNCVYEFDTSGTKIAQHGSKRDGISSPMSISCCTDGAIIVACYDTSLHVLKNKTWTTIKQAEKGVNLDCAAVTSRHMWCSWGRDVRIYSLD